MSAITVDIRAFTVFGFDAAAVTTILNSAILLQRAIYVGQGIRPCVV